MPSFEKLTWPNHARVSIKSGSVWLLVNYPPTVLVKFPARDAPGGVLASLIVSFQILLQFSSSSLFFFVVNSSPCVPTQESAAIKFNLSPVSAALFHHDGIKLDDDDAIEVCAVCVVIKGC